MAAQATTLPSTSGHPEVRLISYANIRDEGAELLAQYADECSIAALGKPNPNWETYAKLETSGALRCFGAYEGERMVGFAVLIVYELPHYSMMTAVVESLFVLKDYRRCGTGTHLIETIELYAKHVGHCVAILYSAPAGGRLEAMLGHKYARTNAVFSKNLR